MVYSPWLGPFGWGIFFIGLIAAIILFAIKRKFYPVMYLISIATYIFTVGFIIDAFNFDKNGVLLMLAISAVIFICLGVYFGYKFKKAESKTLEGIPRKR
jgi:FtsH-binding integral membrane protein